METGGGSFESYSSWQRRQERPPQNLREEVERMYLEAPTELGKEILGKILEMLDAKERFKKLAAYIAAADPKDIKSYYPQKKLGILLVCDTASPFDYKAGKTLIEKGDRIIQLHLPPRNKDQKNNGLLPDLKESFKLTAQYIKYNNLNPKFITGCSYEPLIKLTERRFGFNAVRVNIPEDWAERIKKVFNRYVDGTKEPEIGFIYQTKENFLSRFLPRS